MPSLPESSRAELRGILKGWKRQLDIRERIGALVTERGLTIDTAIDMGGLLPEDLEPMLEALENASDDELTKFNKEIGMFPPLYLWDSMPDENKEAGE